MWMHHGKIVRVVFASCREGLYVVDIEIVKTKIDRIAAYEAIALLCFQNSCAEFLSLFLTQ